MGIGTSMILIAAGAILDFAVDVRTTGYNLHTIGLILMIVGAVGLLFSLLFWNSWGGVRRSVIYDDEGAAPAHRRRVVRDEIIQ
jgi:hypothetical protein